MSMYARYSRVYALFCIMQLGSGRSWEYPSTREGLMGLKELEVESLELKIYDPLGLGWNPNR